MSENQVKEGPEIKQEEFNEAMKQMTELGLKLESLKIPFLIQVTVDAELPAEERSKLTYPDGRPIDENVRTLATRTLTNINDFSPMHLNVFVEEFKQRVETITAARELPDAPAPQPETNATPAT